MKHYRPLAPTDPTPRNHERVYDIETNRFHAVPKLPEPRTVVVTLRFTNEQDAELLQELPRCRFFVSMVDQVRTPEFEGAD